MKMRTVFAFTLVMTTSAAWGQTQPEDVRRILGGSVDVIPAAAFAATTASHRDFCGNAPELDGHAEIIMRLEFGSLESADKERYTAAMTRQYHSNASIYNMLGEDAQRSFCRELNSSILRRAAEFVRKHPQLFEAKAPPPRSEPRAFADVAAGTLTGLKPLERLYVVRVAENHMMADVRKLLADAANKADGYVWAIKVMALEFALLAMMAKVDHPEVAAAYDERAELYAKYVRGEIDGPQLQTQERVNEQRKNAVYRRLLDGYSTREATPSRQRLAQLEAVAKELGDMVIGNAKAKSVR